MSVGIADAFEIVLDLARGNVLEECEAPHVDDEFERQSTAVDILSALCEKVSALQDNYRVIARTQNCFLCQRHHDVGAVMHYSVAALGRHFMRAYFCVDCGEDIEYEKPPWQPGGNRHGM